MSSPGKRLDVRMDNLSDYRESKKTVEGGSPKSFLGDLKGKKHDL